METVYALEEPAGSIAFADSSGNNLNGTCSGPNCPFAGAFARPRGPTNADSDLSLVFDGLDDQVRLGNPARLNQGGQLTSAAWVRPQAADGFRNIVAHGYTAAPNAEVFLRINNGRYEIGSADGADHLAASPAGAATADIGQWVPAPRA